MSSCPICLETISSTKASPNVCDHLFCLQCLSKWSKLESFCPVDRKRFRKIINLDTGTSCEIKRRGKKRKKNVLYDVSAFCEVCKSGEKDDTLLLCDSCDLAYHCECLNPPLSAVPSGRWFCPVCQTIDKRMELQLNKKPREESCQSFFQTSNCIISTETSSNATLSSKNSATGGPINHRKKHNTEESCSKMVQSLSFPSTSTCSQLNAVKISKEDYQTLCAHSKSLFLAPGFTVSPNATATAATEVSNSFPNESHEVSTSHYDSSQHLVSNSEVKITVCDLSEGKDNESNVKNKEEITFASKSNKSSASSSESCLLPVGKDNESNIKNKENENSSRSTQLSDIIYKSPVSQLKEKKFSVKSNKSSSSSEFDKHKNDLKDQLSDVSVLQTLLLPGKEKEKCESIRKEVNASEEIKECSDSSDCEVIFDSSNCITVNDSLNSNVFQHTPQISIMNSIAKKNSTEITSENQSAPVGPASLNSGCLRDENLTEIISDHVSETEDENGDLPDPLDDFEIRSSQYAAKAKMNLAKELKQIEEEKWKLWTPHKKAKLSTATSSSNLLEVPRTKKPNPKRTSDSKRVFNLLDYTRRVKKGKSLHANREIWTKYRAFAARTAEKSDSKPKLESDVNVFVEPLSQLSLIRGGTKMTLIPKDSSFSKQSYPLVLHRDLPDLSMRVDGSFYLNWSVGC